MKLKFLENLSNLKKLTNQFYRTGISIYKLILNDLNFFKSKYRLLLIILALNNTYFNQFTWQIIYPKHEISSNHISFSLSLLLMSMNLKIIFRITK